MSAVEWEKTQLQELDITGTDLTSECLIDLLTRIPALRWLSAGQQDSFNYSVRSHESRIIFAFKVIHEPLFAGLAGFLRSRKPAKSSSTRFGPLREFKRRMPLQVPYALRAAT